MVVVDVNAEGGAETVKLIKDAGGDAAFVQANVSVSTDVQAMVRFAQETFGGLDCAINNAMVSTPFLPLADIEKSDWERSIAVNLTGVFLCIKYGIRAMLARGGGSIVNIGSGNEFAAAPGIAPFVASKRGSLGLAAVAALDYGDKNIPVNGLGSDVMVTPAMRIALDENPKHRAFLESLSPMNRLSDPSEVAEAAIWLCSDKASFVHGHTMVADGGAGAGKVMKMA